MAVPPPVPVSPGERAWTGTFFYLSALMGAFALVDFDAGRIAHGLGDAGVSCLLLSLMNQFPFVRAVVRAGSDPNGRERIAQEVQRLRDAHPWNDRLNAAGWSLMLGSLALRAFGVA